MKDAWLNHCLDLSSVKADFYAANRKIIRNKSLVFKRWKDDLTLKDIGYTTNKLKRLIKDYIHEESRSKSIELWKHFVKRNTYSSTSFHTYNHLVKSGVTQPSESVETRGPCLQSVVITLLPKRKAAIDVFYRTTELYKKFPADLFLVNELLKPFDFSETPIVSRTFHFANITCHPMYIIVPVALDSRPIDIFEAIRVDDPEFFKVCMKWMYRYLVDDTGIIKYQQAMRNKQCAIQQLKETGTLKQLTHYVKEMRT